MGTIVSYSLGKIIPAELRNIAKEKTKQFLQQKAAENARRILLANSFRGNGIPLKAQKVTVAENGNIQFDLPKRTKALPGFDPISGEQTEELFIEQPGATYNVKKFKNGKSSKESYEKRGEKFDQAVSWTAGTATLLVSSYGVDMYNKACEREKRKEEITKIAEHHAERAKEHTRKHAEKLHEKHATMIELMNKQAHQTGKLEEQVKNVVDATVPKLEKMADENTALKTRVNQLEREMAELRAHQQGHSIWSHVGLGSSQPTPPPKAYKDA